MSNKSINKGVNQYLDFLIDLCFQGKNRRFYHLKMRTVEKRHAGCYLPKLDIKDYNNMIDGKIIFDQPVKSNFRKFHNIWKISTGKGAGYTTGCLLDYNYFKERFKVKAIDLSKQKHLNYDLKAIQQINFTGNL